MNPEAALLDPRIRPLLLSVCMASWTMIGLGILLGVALDSPQAWHADFPLPIRVAEWWLAAVLATSTMLTGRHRFATIVALMIGPAIRFMSYMSSWAEYLLPGGEEGNSGAWYLAVVNLPTMIVVVVVALVLRTPPKLKGVL